MPCLVRSPSLSVFSCTHSHSWSWAFQGRDLCQTSLPSRTWHSAMPRQIEIFMDFISISVSFYNICELAQRSLKGSYAHRDEPHDSFQKVTELDCWILGNPYTSKWHQCIIHSFIQRHWVPLTSRNFAHCTHYTGTDRQTDTHTHPAHAQISVL